VLLSDDGAAAEEGGAVGDDRDVLLSSTGGNRTRSARTLYCPRSQRGDELVPMPTADPDPDPARAAPVFQRVHKSPNVVDEGGGDADDADECDDGDDEDDEDGNDDTPSALLF